MDIMSITPYGTMIAVGNNGAILRTTDGGGDFTVVGKGLTSNDLNDVSNDGYNLAGVIVGNNGTLLETVDDGQTWNVLVSPTTENLYSVDFDTASGFGLTVGAGETILQTPDRGYTWNIMQTNPASSVIYRKVQIVDIYTAYVLGDDAGGGQPKIIRTLDQGASWSEVMIQQLQNVHLYGLNMKTNSDTGIVVGSGGTMLRTVDGGLTWGAINSGITEDLYAVLFNEEICLAVGNKVILKSFNNGDTWEVDRPANINGALYAIFQWDYGNYFIAGE
jgi:photosystem II stability/assembly factor-like uncharacterized protein